MLVHALLGVYFVYIGILPLVILCIFDALVYMVAMFLNKAQKVRAASFILLAKAISFSILATFLLGTDVNVQWLILLVVLPVTTHLDFTKLQRIIIVATIPLTINLQFVLQATHTPIFDMSDDVFLRIFFANIVVWGVLAEVVAYGILTKITVDTHAKDADNYRNMSFIDPLTKLNNRRYADRFFEKLNKSSDAAHVLCLIDIDDFKSINDTHGHDVGDIVLTAVAGVIRQSIRQTDLACRWGGEEFLIGLTDCAITEAREILEKIRRNIEELAVPSEKGEISVTVTGGADVLRQASVKETLTRCDEKLYEGKQNGKNVIVI